MISNSKTAPFILETIDQRLQLRKSDEPKLGSVCVDFVKGSNAHRRKFGGGRRQAIARAVGLKKGATPSILDATAGLGRDAFVLASLGCRVHMLERSPIITDLLADGLQRAKNDAQIGTWISKRLTLDIKDSTKGLSSLPFKPDVVYLDPMYPEKKKSALVKKEMRMLQLLLGNDLDSDNLLEIALNIAQQRVVVKRSAHASHLADKTPNATIKTQKNRFDIYLIPNQNRKD